jgi:hypothetical protein
MALTKMELAEQRNGKPQGGAAAAAAAAAAADGGRRTKHDDMTVAVVLLPRWMLEENRHFPDAHRALERIHALLADLPPAVEWLAHAGNQPV